MTRKLLVSHRFVLLSVCALLAGVMIACAAKGGVDGKWIAQLPAREGQTRETTFNFKTEGNKLTGTVSGRGGDNPISDGQVNGEEISFTVTASFRDNEVKLVYKARSPEMKFTSLEPEREGISLLRSSSQREHRRTWLMPYEKGLINTSLSEVNEILSVATVLLRLS